MTRAEAKDASRQAILAAARNLFTLLQYEHVTVRMIARSSGYSTGALFAHWPSKAALFRELYGRRPINDELGAQLLEGLRNIAAGSMKPGEITAFVQSVIG